ncbi:MAG: hypothetical protein ACOZQL_39770 [Myxococcota bacterium]
MRWLIGACMVSGLVAGGFLAWTLTHLRELGLTVSHPRVLVEGTLMIGFFGAAVALLVRR